MADIKDYLAESGNLLNGKGEVKNVADILAAEPINNKKYDIRDFAVRSGIMLNSEGKACDVVSALEELAAGSDITELEERVANCEIEIKEKADINHNHEIINDLIKQLYVNAYDGSECQLSMLCEMSGGISEIVSVGKDKIDNIKAYICNNGDCYLAGEGETNNWAIIGNPFEEDNKVKALYVLNGVTTIGNNMFFNCTELTKVIMSNTVVRLEESSFDTCINLKVVKLSENLAFINTNTFYCCESIKSIKIPNSVVSLGDWAVFRGCTSLESVKLSNSLQLIPEDTFYDCCSLKTINIPNSVINIGNNCFTGCTALTSITIDKEKNSISGGPWGITNANVIWLR